MQTYKSFQSNSADLHLAPERKHRDVYLPENRNSLYVVVTCSHCKSLFGKELGNAIRTERDGQSHFCSQECYQSSRKPKLHLQENNNYFSKSRNNYFYDEQSRIRIEGVVAAWLKSTKNVKKSI